MKTNIDLVGDTDSFPYATTSPESFKKWQDSLYTLLWEDEDGEYPIGHVPSRVFQELLRVPVRIKGEMDFNETKRTIKLFQLPTEEERTAKVSALSTYWREKQTFKLLKGWRDEPWPVYSRKGELLFSMERAALGLLGAMRYGVHMIAYVNDPSAPYGIKIWTPKRAANKSTFPSMLDNTVAGGLMTGEDPFECIVREADEEASLPESLVRSKATCVGTITYIYVTEEQHIGEDGFIYPECQWVYHLELPNNVIPKPKDGEVEEFRLDDVDQVKRDLADGQYKSNCAICILDFFIRRGILTEENEPRLAEIQQRIHRDISFPGPHQSQWQQKA
ncbi:NUDIX hydrolase domain-like protein [Stachybotrys elegans]|uniref:NUDIX hydrolase domain-like protein n=1 Tax=Stachybotrys elegans TaxID=80388 RepID=A0A8K0SZN4_9HYPO|nr:NUDIX hydrolase domain-like protein [Stachybotrys elegans]